MEQVLKTIKEELQCMECTGPHCQHETAEKHFIIDEEWFNSVVERLIN